MNRIFLSAKLYTLAFLTLIFTSINGVASADVHAEKILQFARDVASLGGAARYCKLDPELIEEYITKARAQVAGLANDDYEKVMGSMEFSNMLAAASGVAPKTDCKTIEMKFKDSLRSRS